MGGKWKSLAYIAAGVAAGLAMSLLLYAVCPLFDTDFGELLTQAARASGAARIASLFMLFFPPLIPPTVSIISLIRKLEHGDALMNILLAGIIAFIIQLLYVLAMLQ